MSKRPDKIGAFLVLDQNVYPPLAEHLHKEKTMFRKLWHLLAPFHPAFKRLVLLAILYEAGGVLISYTVPTIVRLFEMEVQIVIWALVVISMLSWNEAYMRLDNKYDWKVAGEIYEPIRKFLRLLTSAKFLRMPLIWHQTHNSGTLVGKVGDGIWRTLDIISMISWEFMPTMVQTVLSLVPMIYFSPYVAMLCVITMVIFVWLTLIGEEVKKPIRAKRQDLIEKDWAEAVSMVQAIETVITLGLKKFMIDRLTAIQDAYEALTYEEIQRGIFVDNRWRIRVLTTVRVLIYGLWVVQLHYRTIDVPSLIFVSILMERLFGSYWKFARLADRVYGNSEAMGRLINLMSESEPIDTGREFVDVEGPVGISFDHVCLAYKNDYSEGNGALHDLSLTFEAGKVTAIVGPTGAGKSSIFTTMTALFEIHNGQIKVAGVDIKDWDKRKLLEIMAPVPPGDKVFLWPESFAFNIRISWPNASDEEVIAAAKRAGIHDFIVSQDKGYDTLIGERGVKLSSGQKQRVAIARALLRRHSKIIILDEPTSAVDAQTEHLIMKGLKEMFVGRTVIVIAHRLSTVRDADKIIVLEKGRNIEEGNHKSLVASGGLYAKMVAMQIESERLD